MKGFSRFVNILKGIMLGAVLLACAGFADAQANVSSQINISTSFGNASGLALDTYGNLYVADSSYGSLSLFSGANGSASTVLSSLNTPGQIAVDTSFNLYVASEANNAVYKYSFVSGALNLNTPSLLGTGLGKVTGVAVDLSGNIYIVDNGNKKVVEISGTTQTTLMSGLTDPRQIAVDKYGNVYVADAGANAVVYLPKGGTATTVGSGQKAPQGVAVDASGNVYIADTGNNAVEEVPYSSTTSAPDTSSQTTLGVTVSAPTALIVDTRGSIYIAAGDAVIHYNNGAIYFGLQAVNQSSQSFPVVFTFTSSVAPATIKVLTQGQTGQDFQDAGSSTCTAGVSYSAGQSCTVNVNFKPLFAGARYGAIVFYDSSNNPLLREYIGGGGLGPVLTIDQSTLVAPAPTVNSTALKVPYSVKPDLFGNLYIADTSNTRIVYGTPTVTGTDLASGSTQTLSNSSVVLAAAGAADDIAINGAGDLYAATTGGVFFYPNLNGTLSTTSTQVSTTTNKYRIINVDIAGNAYSCDVTANKLYSLNTTQTAATQIQSGVTSACLGVAVDLYGNLAISDSTLKGYYYVPANGRSTIAQAIGLTTPWGVAFDASGSIYMTDYGANYFYRVPNEYGTPNASDVLKMTGNKAYSVALDPYGNAYMTTVSSTATYYNVLARSYPYITQAPITTLTSTGTVGYAQYKFTTSLSVGKSTAGLVTLSNSGTQVPTYTLSSGYQVLGDVDDFTLTGTPSSVPAYATCNFATGLPRGQQCYVPVTYSPTSPGVVRSMSIQFPSDATYTSVMTIVGSGKDTAASTASRLAVAVTNPSGTIYPTESITLTATAATAATGAVTLMVDGVASSAGGLSSGSVSFTLPSGLTTGSHTIGVTYAGDATYAPVTTPVTITVTVVKIPSTATLVANGNQANVGQAVILTGTVATKTGYADPSGTMTFYDGSTAIGTATVTNGVGSLTVSSLASGTHTLTFTYSGDSLYANSTSTDSVQVIVGNYQLSQTALTVTPSMPVGGYDFGSTLAMTAQVSAVSGSTVPTGSVLINVDGSVSSVALSSSGTAAATITPHAGSHVILASYAGDTNFAFSNSSTFVHYGEGDHNNGSEVYFDVSLRQFTNYIVAVPATTWLAVADLRG
jgi:sugar lactone lactonase YvrE